MKLFSIGKFFGENNTKNEYELHNTELKTCLNSIINNNNEIIRRRGGTILINGISHSLWKPKFYDFCLVVVNNRLLKLNKDGTTEDLNCELADGELVTYREIQDKIVFSNGIIIKYLKDNIVYDFPIVTEEGYEPIYRYPTKVFDFYNGRLYLGVDDCVYATDLYNISKVDLINGYRRFPYKVTMIEAAGNGIYVSSDKLYFMEGASFSKMKLNVVSEFPALEGQKLKIDAQLLNFENVKLNGSCVIWASKNGLYAGTDNGQVFNLTKDRFKFSDLNRVNISYLSHDNCDYILINHLH